MLTVPCCAPSLWASSRCLPGHLLLLSMRPGGIHGGGPSASRAAPTEPGVTAVLRTVPRQASTPTSASEAERRTEGGGASGARGATLVTRGRRAGHAEGLLSLTRSGPCSPARLASASPPPGHLGKAASSHRLPDQEPMAFPGAWQLSCRPLSRSQDALQDTPERVHESGPSLGYVAPRRQEA